MDSTAACLISTAQVSTIELPGSTADTCANQVIAHFCSAGEGRATEARFVLDQPGGSKGRLKVVALDPTDPDSSRVISSNEVTYNGSVSGTYSPIVLRATSSHPTSDLRIEAIGVGLSDAPRVEITAPDTSWRLALQVEQQSDTRLTAVARVAADLPPFELNVGLSSGEVGVASLQADAPSALSVQPACTDEMKEINLVSHENIQPKDFAIVASRDSFHIFYTRQDYNLGGSALDSRVIGHRRSHDLYNWDPDEHTMHSVVSRPGMWDGGHVWAPTIIKKPGDITYFMLYTGVDSIDVQRIGVATSTDLNVWTQDSAAIYQASSVTWALTGTHEFRDAFVMADPDSAGRYLLYFVTKTQARKRFVVGVARTDPVDPVNLRKWKFPQPLWNTDSLTSRAAVIESPHAFKDPGDRWWLFYTGYSTGATKDSAFVTYQTNDVSPADLDTTRWSAPDTLYRSLGGDQKIQFWHASEYLGWSPDYEYLLAFNDSEHSISISQVSWHGPHAFVLTDSCPPTSVLDVPGSKRSTHIELEILGHRPANGPMAFRIHTPPGMPVQLAIFDMAGRRVRTLVDTQLADGVCEARWDGRGAEGNSRRSGIYFARLVVRGEQRVAKIVLLR